MTQPITFSSHKFDHKIFLHAIDGQFEFKNLHNLNDTQDDINEVNVKFLLSLDEDENINDVSTEGNSEGEETMKDILPPVSFKNNDNKIKINGLLNTGEDKKMKTEIDKIRGDTIKNMRNFQTVMFNKMLAMKQYYQMNQVNAGAANIKGSNLSIGNTNTANVINSKLGNKN